jgi:hypothetical protein
MPSHAASASLVTESRGHCVARDARTRSCDWRPSWSRRSRVMPQGAGRGSGPGITRHSATPAAAAWRSHARPARPLGVRQSAGLGLDELATRVRCPGVGVTVARVDAAFTADDPDEVCLGRHHSVAVALSCYCRPPLQ